MLNVMAYDFHGPWEAVTGHQAPLYDRPDESTQSKKLNVVSSGIFTVVFVSVSFQP